MKKTRNLWMILAVLLFAASCQNSDIDGGQVINDGKLNLTATIVTPDATRVTYAVDNDVNHVITPSWTVGDEIIGWDDQGETFTFTVSAVDAGRATLDAGTYVPGSATKLYAIYAPGKTPSNFGGSGSARTLDIDLSSQNGVLNNDSPVLMCATAEITAGSASLSFENQTAIIGVTKFKLPAAATITSISVDGLVTAGTFEVSGDVLVLTPATTTATATATGSWATGEGNICTTAIYFATLPTASAKIALRASDGVNDYGNLASIAATNVVAGNYYYMAKNLGAPVADVNGVKYGTIDDAWAAANRANSAVTVTLLDNCSAAARLALDATGTGAVTFDLNGHNLVTANQIRVTGRSLTLTDNSSAVLAEQGVISTTYTGGRLVYVNGGSFTMLGGTLSRTGISGNYQAVFAQNSSSITLSGGKVVSDHSSVYAETESSITIDGNTIIQADSTGVNNNGGTLLIEGSPVITASLGGAGYGVRSQGTGTTTIRGTASITGDNALYAQTGTTVTISGNPTAHSDAGATLYAAGATITVSGGTFSRGGTGNGYVAYTGNADGRINISGGTFTNTPTSSVVRAYTTGSIITVTGGTFISTGVNPIDVYNGTVYVSGGCFNKPVQPIYAVDASTNKYVNVLNTDPSTSETCPFTLSAVSSTPKVATVTQSTYTWECGTVECAVKAADLRAKANGNATVMLDADCTASAGMSISSDNAYNITLDLKGRKVTSSSTPALSVASNFVLCDTEGTGDFSTTAATALDVTAGTTDIATGSLVAATNAVTVNGGTLMISGGYYYGGGTADIVMNAGTVSVSGGWFRSEPSGALLASGYSSSATSTAYNTRSYDYTVEGNVATVNGVSYTSWDDAVAAANAYSEADETVMLQLQLDIAGASAAAFNNTSSKPIVLDLNGHTLATATNGFITSTGTARLTITDSNATKGKITSSAYNLVNLTTSGTTVYLSGCVLESTAPASTTNGNAVVAVNYDSKTTRPVVVFENDTKAYSTHAHCVCYVKYGTVTLNDCEITSGKDEDNGGNGVFFNTGAQITINNGASIYSPHKSGDPSGSALRSGTGNSASTLNINGGWLYGGYSVSCGSGYSTRMTFNGGYFNTDFSDTALCEYMTAFKYGTGKTIKIVSPVETYTHATTGEVLSYGYQVTTE